MLADRVTNFLQEKSIITDDDKDVVKFGLESLAGNLLGFLLTLSIGAFFKHFLDAVILWAALFPLRKTVGGYHASTKIGCFCVSTALLVFSFALFTTFDCKTVIYGICSFVTGSVIWIFAPVENPMKKLDFIEYKVYKIRSRKILVLEECILILALFFQCEYITRSIGMAISIVSISVLLGKL